MVAEVVGETELLDPKKGSGVCVGGGAETKKKKKSWCWELEMFYLPLEEKCDCRRDAERKEHLPVITLSPPSQNMLHHCHTQSGITKLSFSLFFRKL